MNHLRILSLLVLMAGCASSSSRPDIATPDTQQETTGDAATPADLESDIAAPPAKLELRYVDASATHLKGAAAAGRMLLVADIDKDGDPDWLQAVEGGPNRLFINNGSGHFMDQTAQRMPDDAAATVALALADVNRDGLPDLFLANAGTEADALLLGSVGGAFLPAPTDALTAAPCDSQQVVSLDLEGDGDVDFAVACRGMQAQQRLYRNDDGLLADVSALHLPQAVLSASDVLALDVDGDDDIDLLFAGDGEPCQLFLNDGAGVFGLAAPTALPTSSPAVGQRLLAGDMNGDGKGDIYLPGSAQDRLWRGDGTGHFWDASETALGPEVGGHQDGVVADLDRDGAMDLVLIGTDGALTLLRNDGAGRFFDYSAKLPAAHPLWNAVSVATALLDDDLAPDLLVSTHGTPPRELLSAGIDAAGDYHWQDPWPLENIATQSCDGVAATAQSMAEKAAYYDWIVPKLHQSFGTLDDGRVIDFSHVQRVVIEGPYPTTIVPDAELPAVVGHISYGNAGLWTSKYVVSQAFRYAVTGSQEALENVRSSLTANYVNLKITGTPGFFARGFWPPLPGHIHPDPTDESKYGGYHLVSEGPYAGFTWKTDTSKDEYAGHLFAIGVVAKLVDDPEILAMVKEMAQAVGNHLREHNYWITDEAGNPTTYGSVMALSLDHIPAFNALHALAWTSISARVSGDPLLLGIYQDCLLQRAGYWPCIDYPTELPMPYTEHLSETSPGLLLGCDTNYDNVGMMMMALFNLIWFEENPELRAFYQERLVAFTKGPDKDGFDLWMQQNPWFNFLFATFQPKALASQGRPGAELVKEGLCTLKRFPATKQEMGSSTLDYPEYCESDRHGPLTDEITDIELRCPRQFVWWTSPYKREVCQAKPNEVAPPQDYLVTYWFGRYLGFIDESM